MTNQIYPCLWFDGNAKEAAEFYCGVFPGSRITADTPMVVNFALGGQQFMGLNGGPTFAPNPSISFFVACESVEEAEGAWKILLEGGKILMPLDRYDWSEKYGWVQDRFGVSWQLACGKKQEVRQKFTPTLMFTNEQAGKAQEAINFYTSVFDGSDIIGILKYTADDDDVEGTVKHAQFRLGKNHFMAMDSSLKHLFGFNEGISLVVECKNQEEIDYYWDTFTRNGEESRCGWVKDQYGVSWQIIPANISQLMSDAAKAPQVMDQIMKMKKIHIEPLVQAYEGA